MKQVFKSKVDKALVIVIYVAVIGSVVPMMFLDFSWAVVIGAALLLAVLTWLLTGIRYTIDGEWLLVTCRGLSLEHKINVHSISHIRVTHTILSAPAASFDRIELRHGRHHSVVLSPCDKKAFVDALQAAANGGITVTLCDEPSH